MLRLLQRKSAGRILGLEPEQVYQLVTFILKFKNIFEIDFQTDPLASMLLRRVFCETEKLDEEELEKAGKVMEQKEEAKESDNPLDIMNYKVQEVKPFSMEDVMD